MARVTATTNQTDAPAKGEKLSDFVYRKVLYWLLQGQLHPGQMLNRKLLAKKLGVSVAPVLEALLALERDGLVEAIPRRGTQIRYFRPDDLRGQLLLRLAVEAEAARHYCGQPIRQNREHLRTLAERVDQTPAVSIECWCAETAFHRALVKLANLPILTETFDRTMKCSFFVGVTLLAPVDQKGSDHAGHIRLLDKLEQAEPDEAERLIREHLSASASRHMLLLREYDRTNGQSVAPVRLSAAPRSKDRTEERDPFVHFLNSIPTHE